MELAGALQEQEETEEMEVVSALIERMELLMSGTQDVLLGAKLSQAHHANKYRAADPKFMVGDKVMLAIGHRCHE